MALDFTLFFERLPSRKKNVSENNTTMQLFECAAQTFCFPLSSSNTDLLSSYIDTHDSSFSTEVSVVQDSYLEKKGGERKSHKKIKDKTWLFQVRLLLNRALN